MYLKVALDPVRHDITSQQPGGLTGAMIDGVRSEFKEIQAGLSSPDAITRGHAAGTIANLGLNIVGGGGLAIAKLSEIGLFKASVGSFGRLAAQAGEMGGLKSMPEKLFTSEATNRLQLEKLRTQYRQIANWTKPSEIQNPKLYEVVKGLYREDARIGSGSTADAVRAETAMPGTKIGGNQHIQKANNAVRALDNLLKSRSLSAHDHMIAENIRLDLLDSMGNKLWYSQTSTPKLY